MLRKRTYPFIIPEVHCPPPETLEKLAPWGILEFFRVEALLRSKKIHQIYRRRKREAVDFKIMGPKYGFDFDEVLDEARHHNLIGYLNVVEDPLSPILDITSDIKKKKDLKDAYTLKLWISPQYKYFRLDCRNPPETIIKRLKPLLKKAHQDSLALPLKRDVGGGQGLAYHPYKKPPIHNGNLSLWLQYLNCYDLRECEALSFGIIAKRIFDQSGTRAYKRVQRIHGRVTELIVAAEQNIWPPKIS